MTKPQCSQYYVYDRRTMGSIQCKNKAWKDGICKIHHPENRAAIQKRHDERGDALRKRRELDKVKSCTSSYYAWARKEAGLLTFEEAAAIGADLKLLKP